jgi:predicted metalloendopeptidase
MAVYRYDEPTPSPLIGSIADIIQKQGALQGMQATQLAEITAKSAAVRGANWGQAVQSLGQLPMQVMEQNRRDQIANMDALYKTQQMQVSQASLQDAGAEVCRRARAE